MLFRLSFSFVVFTNGAPGPLTASRAAKPEIEYRMDTETFAAVT
jgi:hypothetical protein